MFDVRNIQCTCASTVLVHTLLVSRWAENGAVKWTKKMFSVANSGFSSVPKHNVMEHDGSLLPG